MAPTANLYEDANNPRTEIPEADLDELADDIRQHGILHRNKMLLGALCRSELAREVQALDYDIGYTVWIAGRHVACLGRRGETHIERFPD